MCNIGTIKFYNFELLKKKCKNICQFKKKYLTLRRYTLYCVGCITKI